MKLTQTVQQKEKGVFTNEDNIRELWDIRWNNIHIIGAPEGEGGAEKLFAELMAKNFLNLGRKQTSTVQETEGVPN